MTRTRGPLAEMLLEGGFSPEHTRRVVRFFSRNLVDNTGRPEMEWVIGTAAIERLECDSEQAIQRAGGEITFQVRVFSSNKDFHKENGSEAPEYESLTTVLAHTAEEAKLLACQMAACKRKPLWAEVLTDSTLTCL